MKDLEPVPYVPLHHLVKKPFLESWSCCPPFYKELGELADIFCVDIVSPHEPFHREMMLTVFESHEPRYLFLIIEGHLVILPAGQVV